MMPRTAALLQGSEFYLRTGSPDITGGVSPGNEEEIDGPFLALSHLKYLERCSEGKD